MIKEMLRLLTLGLVHMHIINWQLIVELHLLCVLKSQKRYLTVVQALMFGL